MHRIFLAVLLGCMVSSTITAQSTLKARIPASKPKVYRAIRDGKDWRNPYLIVNEDGVQVRRTGDDYDAQIVSVAEVLGVLEKLPASAWPYGLVVALQENGICCRESDGQARKHANWRELMDRLRRAGIVVSLVPSA
jgi:hypothetical protein